MSRTYRVRPEWFKLANGVIYTFDEYHEIQKLERGKKKKMFIKEKKYVDYLGCYVGICGTNIVPSDGWKTIAKYDFHHRDGKCWNKPPKWYKQINRRNERAKVRNAIRLGKEAPLFKKYDQWDWT